MANMIGGTSACKERRIREGVYERMLVGLGIDIGCGSDPITEDCHKWDIPQGDAQVMQGVPPEVYSWVYSSHCLEHMRDPFVAIRRWWELVKPGGWMLIVVPDEDLYEQGVFPSRFNPDHKFTFTVSKSRSWSAVSINVMELVGVLANRKVEWIRTSDTGYDYSGGVWDRTPAGAEANIEIAVRKLVRP